MNGHDCLAAWIIPMPQEIVGSLRPDYFEASPLQRRNDHATPAGPAALSCVRGSDWYQLFDRRREISVGRRNRLAVLPHHFQAQLDRLARVRLRLFQGLAIGHDRWQFGAGDRKSAFRFWPEDAEVSNKHLPT